MARSTIITKLSLDEWAMIMGIPPMHFNGMFNNTLYPNNDCTGPWFQYPFQHSDRIGIDDLAMAIQAAEMEIEAEVGYNLMPSWTIDERLQYPKSGMYGVVNVMGTNSRGVLKSIEARKGHMISGGIRAKTLLQANSAVVRTDVDNDGYAETATVVVPITTTDLNEVHLYYANQGGVDAWEIRPINVSINGGNATITFKSWQIPLIGQQGALTAQPLNAEDVANYETVVDCYRVYNDPGVQVQFLWENGGSCGTCIACQLGSQDGCFHIHDERLGQIVPAAASWDSASQTFTSLEWSNCQEPDQVRLYYYSGYRDNSLTRPYAEMSPYWKYAVAYYAASKLDRAVCGCSNVAEFIERWRRDQMFSSMDKGGMTVTPEFAANRLGTTAGAFYAYRRIHQNGVRVTK